MAEARKPEGGDVEQPPKKSKKLLLIVIITVVLLALIGGVGAFFLMQQPAAEGDEEGDEIPAKIERPTEAHSDDAPPVFVKLDAFTVKLQVEQQEAYLQAVPELRVLDEHLGEKIKQYMPEIRHKLLLILSGKAVSDISTPQGVQQLANEMRATINEIVDPPTPGRRRHGQETPGDQAGPDDPVQAVLFTSFIIQ
ncbi:MAG: flagellar basal body-associated FliL family protein [Gammaproteobacteria bacterium]|nr:flagellar basal body-associated FliL family protein [Gammaproteobacteria bacterium]MBU1415446.1 flagellar basal body-associated FliL family protein [Gammaproteobacteria bacterium]